MGSQLALRLAFLCLAPVLALLLGNWTLVFFTASVSLVAAAGDVLRHRNKCVPFPIYLLVVSALQLSSFVVGSHTLGAAAPKQEVAVHGAALGGVVPMPHTEQEAQAAPASPSIRTISVVIAAHNEHKYMVQTLDGIYGTTPPTVLMEVIIIDDGSSPPLVESWTPGNYANLRVLRHEARKGLIKSKTEGGNMARGDMIMFLDGHVKPTTDWYGPLLRHMNVNYKRVVVPLIPILDPKTWEIDNNAVGVKMMFDWTLFFQWFEDYSDLVPCMSGGLFGITRQWWHESGEYDYGMNMWGAENIEQSIRIWLCGGEIYVARDSRIGHVFRATFPYKINNTEIYLNKLRTVETWFDDYKQNFYDADPAALQFLGREGDISDRLKLKEKLHCKPFKWYVEKFNTVFRDKGMLLDQLFFIRDSVTKLCVTVDNDRTHLIEQECFRGDKNQQWSVVKEGRGIRSVGANKCLDANAAKPNKVGSLAFTYHCFSDSQQQKGWAINHGHIQWNKWCIRGSQDGQLTLDACAQFLQRSGHFEVYNVRNLPEAAHGWQN